MKIWHDVDEGLEETFGYCLADVRDPVAAFDEVGDAAEAGGYGFENVLFVKRTSGENEERFGDYTDETFREEEMAEWMLRGSRERDGEVDERLDHPCTQLRGRFLHRIAYPIEQELGDLLRSTRERVRHDLVEHLVIRFEQDLVQRSRRYGDGQYRRNGLLTASYIPLLVHPKLRDHRYNPLSIRDHPLQIIVVRHRIYRIADHLVRVLQLFRRAYSRILILVVEELHPFPDPGPGLFERIKERSCVWRRLKEGPHVAEAHDGGERAVCRERNRRTRCSGFGRIGDEMGSEVGDEDVDGSGRLERGDGLNAVDDTFQVDVGVCLSFTDRLRGI